jgi:hypothetical protein
MTKPYESVRADQHGFTGTSFGCSCCSQSHELRTDREIRDALLDTANMYLRLAEEYFSMHFAAARYGGEAIREALGNFETVRRNQWAYQAAQEHLCDPGSAGEFGEECARIGLDTLLLRVAVARECFTATQQAIVRTFVSEVKSDG